VARHEAPPYGLPARPEGVPLAVEDGMTRPQLLTGALVVSVAFTAACNRTETKQDAREAAAEVKAVAARAGERLADGWVTAKVQAKFFGDDDIKARYIDVSTRDGTVTLKGFVESDAVRQEALQIARATDGVQQVNDQLLIGQAPQNVGTRGVLSGPAAADVQPPDGARIDDSTVTSLIQAKYFVDPSIKMRNVDVSVSRGVVTLRGQVASDTERAQALLLARMTHGVQRVEDSLTVDASLAEASPSAGGPSQAAALSATPIPGANAATGTPAAIGTSGLHTADAGLEDTLESRLAGDARLKSASIEVSARDGVVLLQGQVATPAAKQRALALARETDGVVQVVDRLTVK
jgi:hyperosmotically inducible protein